MCTVKPVNGNKTYAHAHTCTHTLKCMSVYVYIRIVVNLAAPVLSGSQTRKCGCGIRSIRLCAFVRCIYAGDGWVMEGVSHDDRNPGCDGTTPE